MKIYHNCLLLLKVGRFHLNKSCVWETTQPNMCSENSIKTKKHQQTNLLAGVVFLLLSLLWLSLLWLSLLCLFLLGSWFSRLSLDVPCYVIDILATRELLKVVRVISKPVKLSLISIRGTRKRTIMNCLAILLSEQSGKYQQPYLVVLRRTWRLEGNWASDPWRDSAQAWLKIFTESAPRLIKSVSCHVRGYVLPSTINFFENHNMLKRFTIKFSVIE